MLTGQSRMKKRASWIRERRAVMVSAARGFLVVFFPTPNKVQSSDESSRRRVRVLANCIGRLGTLFTSQRNQREAPRQIPSTAAQRVHHPDPRRRSGASYWRAKDAARWGDSWVRGLLETRPAPGGAHESGSSSSRGSAESPRRITCLQTRCEDEPRASPKTAESSREVQTF